jgi:HK97 family phage major capsid protein
MSNEVLDRLRAERDQCRDTALALMEADDYDPGSEALKHLEERGVSLDGQIERIIKTAERQQSSDALDGRAAKAFQRRTEERSQSYGAPQSRQSWGEAFIRSDEFTTYRGRGQSAMFDLDADAVQSRALPTGVADLIAGGIVAPKTSVDVNAPRTLTPLLDAMSTIQVSTNAIEYVAWAVKTGAAAKVAEKAAKPAIEYGPTVTSTTLDNIAGYTQLTRQLIEDYSAVRSYIDGDLQWQVVRKEEAEAAAVLAAATASIPDATATGNMLSAIRSAIGTVQGNGYAPNAVLMNPADWAALDIVVMGTTTNGPVSRQSFWGLTPIASTTQAAGTAVVGDFRTGMAHYTRSAVALYITDSHADTFLSNVFTLLAERRSKTVLVRPLALCEAKTA